MLATQLRPSRPVAFPSLVAQGQRGIDGGGFKLVTESTSANSAYVYVQFESMRKGYVDDVEFALADGVANMRTSSRLGYLDLGVNAKRFNVSWPSHPRTRVCAQSIGLARDACLCSPVGAGERAAQRRLSLRSCACVCACARPA